MPLDPALRTMLDQLAEAGGPTLSEATPEDGRQMLRMLALLDGEAEPVQRVEDREIAGVPCRVYSPGGDALPILVWYHGGGFVIGDLETTDTLARKLANRVDAVVVSVDYRLAPEHPAPAAVEDACAVVDWVAANGVALGGDPTKIAVGGDSAGGNLAACAALHARDNGIGLRHQLLVYPTVDLTMSFPSIDENGDGYLLTKDSMAWFIGHYVSGGADPKDPSISPYFVDDLSGVAPAHIMTAEFDPLRDEGEAYAERLRDAGVPVQLKRYDGMVHAFVGLSTITPVATQAVDAAADGLRAAFAA